MRATARRSLFQDLALCRIFSEPAHGVRVPQRAFDADLIGLVVDLLGQRPGAGQAEQVIDAIVLAPSHRLGPGVMAIAPERDAGVAPAFADMAHEAAQMRAHLDAARRLAGPQHHGDRAARLRVVDMDGQETTLIIVGVEQRKLLMAARHVARVVDVERDARRRRRVGRQPLVDQRIGQADRVLQRRRVLHPRQRRLRAQVGAGLRRSPARQLERRIGAQKIQVVGVLVAAGDGVDARPDHVRAGVKDARRITAVGKAARQPVRDAKTAFGHRQQHHPAIRGQPPAVESGGDFLGPDGWKRE